MVPSQLAAPMIVLRGFNADTHVTGSDALATPVAAAVDVSPTDLLLDGITVEYFSFLVHFPGTFYCNAFHVKLASKWPQVP